MKYIPMPSPNGTNYAQCYMPATWRATTMAYDAKTPCPLSANMGPQTRQRVADAIADAIERHSSKNPTLDEDPMENDDQHWIEKALEFCEGKLDDADLKELASILHGALDPDAVMDEPPASRNFVEGKSRGQPRLGGKFRSSAGSEQTEAQDRRRRRVGMDSAAYRDFAREFPEVARIKRAF